MEKELSILLRHDLRYREEYTPQDSGTGMQARKSDGWFETNFGRFFWLCDFYEGPYILIKYGYFNFPGYARKFYGLSYYRGPY